MGSIPKHITDRLKQIVGQVSGKIEDSDLGLVEEHKIKGTGIMYCLMSDNRTFTKVTRGVTIYIIEENYDIKNRTLVYTVYGDIVLLEPEEIEMIGHD